MEAEAPPRGPLAGIRVLELGSFIAAPTAGRILGEFGAEVIKVERPGTGDELRQWRVYDGETSLLWRLVGRNKKSLTLDLSTSEGQELIRRLVPSCDVLLENFRPGTLERWGLDPTLLRELNPRLVVVRVSGYGQTGPYRDRPGFGSVAEAIGGLRHLTGYPGQPPVRVGVSLGDQVAGLYAVIGALMGLLGRMRDPDSKAEDVDVALYEAVYSLMESLVPEYDAYGVVRGPAGAGIPGIAATGTYACRDGHVVIGANGDGIFARLMRLVDVGDLGTELSHNAGRLARAEEIDRRIGAWCAEQTCDEALARLRAAAVPAGPIYTVEDIAKDQHFAERGMLEPHRVALGAGAEDDVRFPGIVPKLSSSPGATRWLGPELGQHTHELLAELGVDDEEQQALRERGVI